MPIESIQMPRAPQGWTPNADQAARVQNDPRLRRLNRDDLYHALNNAPRGGQGAMTDAEAAAMQARQGATNAMSWHPRELLNYVTNAIRGATGY